MADNTHTATAEDRKKDSYLSADSKVQNKPLKNYQAIAKAKAKDKKKDNDLEDRSKKAGFYVHGHKNFGDVYEK
jgi:hypothetical protein